MFWLTHSGHLNFWRGATWKCRKTFVSHSYRKSLYQNYMSIKNPCNIIFLQKTFVDNLFKKHVPNLTHCFGDCPQTCSQSVYHKFQPATTKTSVKTHKSTGFLQGVFIDNYYLTLMGGFPVVLETRKFIAMSSQLRCSSTQPLISPGMELVYK